MERYPITPEGLKKLEAELKRLREVDRPANVKAIEEARGHGDLRENADFKCAKDEQAMIVGRIAYLQGRISHAAVIDPSKLSGNRVVFGARVFLKNLDTGEPIVYRLVGEDEADIEQGSISITSPLARGLIRREVGEQAKIAVPSGIKSFEIVKIEF
uniref:Transcription elongation factor GreA n=1 Tax=uncultured Aminicenantes bacterium TaxID=174294 RepID=Q2Z001_9BACT|nr:transcription elongation factor GreA [uncultured Aminicenantes bacterium]